MRKLSLSIALGTVLALAAAEARAMPFNPSLPTESASDVMQVRDGCGAGLRWSNRRQACVTDGAAVGAAVAAGVLGAAIVGTGRHHHRRGWRGGRRR